MDRSPQHRRPSLGRLVGRFIHRRVTPLVRHPGTAIAVGVSMLVTGVAELLQDFVSDFETLLRTYHGLVLFGIVTAMRGFSEMVEAMEWLDRDLEALTEGESGAKPESAEPAARRERAA